MGFAQGGIAPCLVGFGVDAFLPARPSEGVGVLGGLEAGVLVVNAAKGGEGGTVAGGNGGVNISHKGTPHGFVGQ